MTPASPSYAILDGSLCRVSPSGDRAASHAPLATAVAEFLHVPDRLYVREHPYGLLPGIPNLYCLDADLRLQWLAEWPAQDDPCVAILAVEDGALVAASASGARVLLEATTGRLRSVAGSVPAGR
ncbi:hypothetical protein K0B96_02250 [Horticoccus luteus]|uniref:Uncharacterized protein n=1 Tax=Horticoccus luteus TaxID=2862869 RepID=A0A8F9TXB3_9BACT|nr:hypothetical protein [Horticoccus luteus]QYM79458.1 hypothetical protein K0B96_02250 [Horticoccus luteus]